MVYHNRKLSEISKVLFGIRAYSGYNKNIKRKCNDYKEKELTNEEAYRVKKSVLLFMALVMLVVLTACGATDKGFIMGSNGKWSAVLTDKFETGVVKKEEGKVTTTYKGTDGMDLIVVEISNPGYVADEARLEEETTAIDELQATRAEVLDIANFGKVYGAVVEDEQMDSTMFYYMTNVDQDVVYFLFTMKKGYLSEAREGEIKAIITTLTLKK